MVYSQEKGLFCGLQIGIAFSIPEIELSTFRAIMIELSFFPQETQVIFSENRGLLFVVVWATL